MPVARAGSSSLPTRLAPRARRKDRPSWPQRLESGFVRFDLYILLALILLSLAIIVPQYLKHGPKGAFIAFLGVAGTVIGGIAVLLFVAWLAENIGRKGTGKVDLVLRGAGHLLRFLLFGLIASIIATGLVAGHDLKADGENLVSLCAAGAGGAAGSLLFHHLGSARFWPAFGWFCLALLGSLFGGILGLLGPGSWWTDAGILVPLLIFTVLAAMGRIAPPAEKAGADPSPPA